MMSWRIFLPFKRKSQKIILNWKCTRRRQLGTMLGMLQLNVTIIAVDLKCINARHKAWKARIHLPIQGLLYLTICLCGFSKADQCDRNSISQRKKASLAQSIPWFEPFMQSNWVQSQFIWTNSSEEFLLSICEMFEAEKYLKKDKRTGELIYWLSHLSGEKEPGEFVSAAIPGKTNTQDEHVLRDVEIWQL